VGAASDDAVDGASWARVVARRAFVPGTVPADVEPVDASAGAVAAVLPVSVSVVSAAATPALEIRADPTPTITAPVPNMTRRLPIAMNLSLRTGG
jgi:hypothetical protein